MEITEQHGGFWNRHYQNHRHNKKKSKHVVDLVGPEGQVEQLRTTHLDTDVSIGIWEPLIKQIT